MGAVEESQFHYGSIDTKLSLRRIKESLESQFHYGSIDTVIMGYIRTLDPNVSIPLWFD